MEVAANLQVGCRVQATTKEDVKIGRVAFIGITSFAPGKWVGVVLDDDSGKNNGEVQGKKYFSCPDNHGIFVRPNQVTVLEELEAPAANVEGGEPAALKPRPSGLRKPSGISTPSSSIRPPGSGLRMPSATGGKGSGSNLTAAAGSKGSSSNLSSSGSKGSSPNLAAAGESRQKPRQSIGGSSKLKLSTSADKRVDSPSLQSVASEPVVELSTPPVLPSLPAAIGNPDDLEKIRGLEVQVVDLTEKLETIKAKRLEDRNKLKDAEKIKIMHDQLKEYKSKAQEIHKDLQQQLLAAKKESKDIQEQYDTYKDEMSEMQETIELSTLDKEMAEERAESLQEELDSLKEKHEELSTSMQLLQTELESGAGGSAQGVSSYQVKQLEQQNEKLKEALVKMRDMSNSDKSEITSLKKQSDKSAQELSHLKKDRESRIEEIEILNSEILDLKDQVDASLGAEEMVEKLTDKNLELEERVGVLEEEKADLEAINEMNEELQENAREVELDMREQLDMSKSRANQLEQSIQASQLQMADLQATIGKYRELVQNLQYENASLAQKSSGGSVTAPTMPPVDNIEMKARLSESKIQSKVIEMELLQLDITHIKAQLNLTGKFLPESFFQHGQDGDGVQVMLLFSNLVQKLSLLSAQLKSKFPWIPSLSKEDVVKSQKSEQASYGAYLQCYISQLVMQFNKLSEVLNDGDVETYKVFAGLVTEFKAYAKPISQYLDLLQKDQLYESVSIESLAKSLRYFQDYCDKQLETYPFESTNLLRNQAKVLISFAESLNLDLKRLEIILQAGESREVTTLNKMAERVAELLLTSKRLKHCLPNPASGTQVTVSTELGQRMAASIKSVCSAMQVIHNAATQADRALNLQPEVESLPSHQIHQYILTASEVLEDDSTDLYDSLLASVSTPLDRVKVLVSQLEGGSLDAPPSKKEKKESVIELRAEVFRREEADGGSTKSKLIAKEEMVNQLKFELRKKQEEVDEFKVRASMADKKIASASKEREEQVLKLQRKLEESQIQLAKKEKEFEQTMDALQGDIDSLEAEKAAAQTKLSNLSKKQMYDSLAKNSASGIGSAVAQGMVASGLDSPYLLEQIKSLKSTVGWLKEENQIFRSKEMKEKLLQLKPLAPVVGDGLRLPYIDNEKNKQASLMRQQQTELKASLNRLHQNTCKVVGNRKVTNVKVSANSILGSEEFKVTDQLHTLSRELNKLKQQTTAFLASSSSTGVHTPLHSFPKPHSQQASQSRYIGRIRVPTPGKSEKVKLYVNDSQLRNLLLLVN